MSILRRIRLFHQQESKPKQVLAVDTNSKFVYSSGSDVLTTWKKTGWIPPSQTRTDYLFKKNRED